MAENQKGDRPLDYGEINKELYALEGKNDPASNERRAGLLDELITIDMAWGECRRAMGRAASRSARRKVRRLPTSRRLPAGLRSSAPDGTG